jgi:predicted RNA-binding protein (virulence factor B family)
MIDYQTPPGTYQEGQQVALVIKTMTDLGYKAIVDGKYWGILYYNEVFQKLDENQEVIGFIKKIREDGRLDLTLYQTGHHDAKDIGEFILEELEQANGFLAINNNTPPEKIYELFGVSKKKFKMALGGLYKQRKIVITEEGIRLITKS